MFLCGPAPKTYSTYFRKTGYLNSSTPNMGGAISVAQSYQTIWT